MAAVPPLRAFGEAARLTAGLVHIIEQDGTEAVARLVAAAGTPQFEHRVAQLRQDRIADAARAEAETAYTEKGFIVLEQRPQWRDTPGCCCATCSATETTVSRSRLMTR